MRCLYCQNSSLILSPEGEPVIGEDEFFSFLNKRRGILQGVCITGGEPTINHGLEDFIAAINDLGFPVKLDTNGTDPAMLERLLQSHSLSMIAMDIKGSPDEYPAISGIPSIAIDKIKKSAALIMESDIDYEFRTTVADGLLSEDSFHRIGSWLKGAKAYFLQSYVDSEMVLTKGLSAPSSDMMLRYRSILSEYIPNTKIRGID